MIKTLLAISIASTPFAGELVPFTSGSAAKAEEVNRNFNYLDTAKATKQSVAILTSAIVSKMDAADANAKLGAKVDTGTYGKFVREQASKSVTDTSAKRRVDSLAVATKTADTTLARRVTTVEGKVAAPTSVDWSNVKGKPNLWSWSPSAMVTNWISGLPGKMENNVMGIEAGMGTDSGAIAFQKRAVSGTSATVLDLHTDGVINSWGADGGIQTNSVTRIDGNGIGILTKLNVGNSAISTTGAPATFVNSNPNLGLGWNEGPEILPAVNGNAGLFFRANTSNIDSTIILSRGPAGNFIIGFKGLTGMTGTSDPSAPFEILANGVTQIGSTLAVKGNIIAQSASISDLRVAGSLVANPTEPWADYVFEPGYKAMALKEVESFAKANGHLPEVPSAAEVAKDGIDLAKMNAILLKKIEELTLHAVAQEKRMEALQAEVREMMTNR
jgi:hypothetical protein